MRARLRRLADRAFTLACLASIAAILAPLFSIVYAVASRGARALSLSFITSLPAPVGEAGGGVANAIQGTVMLTLLSMAITLPVGVASGVYLAEYGRGKLAELVAVARDALAGTPSIVAGVFSYMLIVSRWGFSALAGAVALSILVIPVVSKATEEALKMVPMEIREAGLALGIRRWRVVAHILLKEAKAGILAGALLSMARVAGETAPLLFTSFGSQGYAGGFLDPCSALPLVIYVYATSPYEEWHTQAWGAALLLMLAVLLVNIAVRRVMRR